MNHNIICHSHVDAMKISVLWVVKVEFCKHDKKLDFVSVVMKIINNILKLYYHIKYNLLTIITYSNCLFTFFKFICYTVTLC